MSTKEKTYLTKWEELVGKTVEKVHLMDTDAFFIYFADQTIAYIVAVPEEGKHDEATLELGI